MDVAAIVGAPDLPWKASRSERKEIPMTTQADTIQRSVLPIPDRTHVPVSTYDAKDPNTKFPPIEPLRPPEGRRSGKSVPWAGPGC